MAKRKKEVVVVDGEEYIKDETKKPKKKKKKCLRCCVAFLITVIVILAAGIGVGCYFGNKILKDQFGTSLGDTFKVLSNFKNYRKVEKNDLNNKPKSGDSDKFVDSLTTAILLNDNVNLEEVKDIFTQAISDALAPDESTPDNSSQPKTNSLTDTDTDTEKSLEDKFLELFVAENIDIERIKAFSGEQDLPSFYLKIVDSQLAAFLNEMFPIIIDKMELNKKLKDALGSVADINVNLKELLSLTQITFYKENNIPRMSMVLKASPRPITNAAIEGLVSADSIFGEGQGNGFLRWCVNAGGTIGKGIANLFFVPKTIYVTADLQMSIEQGQTTLNPKFKINSTTQKDIDTLDKFVNGAINEQLDSLFAADASVGNIIQKLNDAVPLNEGDTLQNNKLSVDAIQLAFDLVINKDKSDTDQRLMASDAIKSLWILGTKTENAMISKTEYDYKNWQFERDGTPENKVVFDENGMPTMQRVYTLREPTVIQADYETALTDAFEKYFGLKTTFDQLMDVLLEEEVTQGDKTDKLIEMFDADLIKAMINDQENGRLSITDKMMAAIIAYSKDTLLERASVDSLTPDSFDPRYIVLHDPVDNNNHNILEIGIEININKIILSSLDSADETISRLLSNIMPNSVLVVAKIDITLDQGITRLPDVLTLDEWGKPQTDDMFNSINKMLSSFGVDSFSLDSIVQGLSDGVRSVMDSLNEFLPIEIDTSKIKLPNTFDAIAQMLEIELTGRQTQDALQLLINGHTDTNFDSTSQAYKDSLIGYDPMNYFADVYAIDNTNYTFSQFMTDMEQGFSGGFMKLINPDRLKTLSNDSSTYNGEIDERMLYKILEHMLTTSSGGFVVNEYQFTIGDVELIKMFVENGHDYAEVTISVNPLELLGGTQSEAADLIMEILPSVIHITLKIDISLDLPENQKQSKIYFNGYEDGKDTVEALLGAFVNNIENDLQDAAKEIQDKFAEALNDINQNSGIINIEFENNKFIMSNIFEVIAEVVDQDDVDEYDMKTVLECILYYGSEYQIDKAIDYYNYFDEGTTPTHISDISGSPTAPRTDFNKILFDEFKTAYPIDGTKVSTLEELTDALSGSATSLADVLSASEFENSVKAGYGNAQGVEIDGLRLAGMIQDRKSTIMTSGNQANYDIKYADIYLSSGTPFIALAIEVPLNDYNVPSDLEAFLTENSIPQNLLITLYVEISQNVPQGYIYDDYTEINLSGRANSQSVLNTIDKFNASGSTVDFNNVASEIRDIFVQLIETSAMQIKPTSANNDGDRAVMSAPNIFDLIFEMNYTRSQFPNGGEQIHQALFALHEDAQDEVIINPIAQGNLDINTWLNDKIAALSLGYPLPSSVNIGMSDSELGSYLKTKSLGFGDIKGLTILAASDTGLNAVKTRQWFNTLDPVNPISQDSTYIAANFMMSFNMLSDTSEAIAAVILPNQFLASVILEWTVDGNGDNQFELKKFIINNMSSSTQNDLCKLFGLNDSTEVFNRISTNVLSLTGSIDGAIGEIKNTINSTQVMGINLTVTAAAPAPYTLDTTAIGQYLMTIAPSF